MSNEIAKVLCVGGPRDGLVVEISQNLVSPLLTEPTKIPVMTESGLIQHYIVVFLTGAQIRFPLAVWETLNPDEMLALILNWYCVKPHVQHIDAPQKESDDAIETS